MKEAIAFHIEGIKSKGLETPQQSSLSSYVEMTA